MTRIRLDGTIVPLEHPFCQAGKEKNLKIYFKHPKGWEFCFRREPLEHEKFYALVALAAGVLVVILFLGGAALK